MGDALERGFTMMDPVAYKNLIESRFNNIAAVPTITSDLLPYLFTNEELLWLKSVRRVI